MQKRILAFFLLIALIGSSFSRFFVYAGFEVNKDYIIKKLCINRGKPWMHCNGRCYLMKKVQQAEQHEKKEMAKDNLNRLTVSFFQKIADLSFKPDSTSQVDPILVFRYSCNYKSLAIVSVFHPPKSVV